MLATEYLKAAINKWKRMFKGIQIEYSYDKDAEYHVIYVGPETIRRGNREYKNAEMKLWTNFMKHYPEENLLITKEDEK